MAYEVKEPFPIGAAAVHGDFFDSFQLSRGWPRSG